MFQIPSTIKDITFKYWLSGISVDTYAKRYQLQYPKEYLYIALNRSYNDIMQLPEQDRKLLTYTVSNYNLIEIQEMFETALQWFTPENKEVLYSKTENGTLVFNGEYNNLSVKHVDEYSNIRTALKICPAIIEVGASVYEPGVILYINRSSNTVLIKESQFRRFARFIIGFRFETYTSFALQCFGYAEKTGSIVTEDEVKKRLKFQRMYNSNIGY